MNRGIAMGMTAYLFWGLVPVFWKQLSHLSSVDVTGHRMVWTFLLLAVVQAVRRSWGDLRQMLGDGRQRRLQLAAAALLSSNWLIFVWAIADDRVVEASLGYFMNPLVNVLLGAVFLGETFRRLQKVSIGVAFAGVLWLAVAVGAVPVVSLSLAFTFAFYGLVKKTVGRPALDTLTLETMFMAVPALGFLVWRAATGHGVIGVSVPGDSVLLMATAAFTAAPLLLFSGAAKRVTLGTLGMMQYFSPTLQLLLGVLVYGAPINGGQLVGYLVVWVAVLLFAVDTVVVMRRNRLSV